MWAEHFVYSAAIAVIAGMFFYHYTGRDSSWIIILLSLVPDIDYLATILRQFRIYIRIDGFTFYHGAFHNLAALLIIGVVIAYVLYMFGIPFLDALIFSIIGFGAHLFEDASGLPWGYAYLWRVTSAKIGLGWLTVAFDEERYITGHGFFPHRQYGSSSHRGHFACLRHPDPDHRGRGNPLDPLVHSMELFREG